MSSQGVISSKEAGPNPGLYPVKGQWPSLSSRIRARDQFSSLSLSADKTLSHCHMLAVNTAFYLFSYIKPHIKHGIQLLKPHHYAAVPSTGVMVGPTSHTPESVSN